MPIKHMCKFMVNKGTGKSKLGIEKWVGYCSIILATFTTSDDLEGYSIYSIYSFLEIN